MNRLFLPLLFVVIVTLFMFSPLFGVTVKIFNTLTDILIVASNSHKNPAADVFQILFLFGFLAIFVSLLLYKKSFAAFSILLMSLPATGRVGPYLGLNVIDGTRILADYSLTATLIYVLLFYLILSDQEVVKEAFRSKSLKLLFYAFTLATVSQYANHTIFNATLISIYRIWSYFALLIIMNIYLQTEKDVESIIKILMYSFLVIILFRVMNNNWEIIGLYKDQMDVSAKIGKYWRVSSIIGPGISYGGYLSFIIVLVLFLHKYKVQSQILLKIVIMILLIELLLTIAKAGLIVLVGMVFLISVMNNSKNKTGKIVVNLGITVFVFLLIQLATSIILPETQLYFDTRILQNPSVVSRLYLWEQSILHVFDNYGLGYGIGNQLMFNVSQLSSYEELPSHNIIFSTIQSNGVYSSIIYFYVYFNTMAQLKSNNMIASKYIFVTLVGYFIFSFTGPADLWYSYPFEGGMITIILWSIGLNIIKINNNKQIDMSNNY